MVIYCSPNKFLNYWGAILPCFAVAPSRGERNGNQIAIDVPKKRHVFIQDLIGTSIFYFTFLIFATKFIRPLSTVKCCDRIKPFKRKQGVASHEI